MDDLELIDGLRDGADFGGTGGTGGTGGACSGSHCTSKLEKVEALSSSKDDETDSVGELMPTDDGDLSDAALDGVRWGGDPPDFRLLVEGDRTDRADEG